MAKPEPPPEHCGRPMTCLGWTSKMNGIRALWCRKCGAVTTETLKKGKVVKRGPVWTREEG